MILMTPVLASATAMQLVQTAVEHAMAKGWKVAVCVVDPAGAPLAAWRMDEVTPPIVGFAADKAYTAATMRRSTAAYFERMDASASLRLGLSNRDRLLVWGGGLPVVHEGKVIAGIGVSGAQDFEDIECARTALELAGLGWQI